MAMTTIYLYDMLSFNCISKTSNGLIVIYNFSKTPTVHTFAAVKKGSWTHINTFIKLYSVLLCKNVLCCNDRTERHFNKCLITFRLRFCT